MNKKLVSILIARNMTISIAESCTGGLLSSTIIDVPNASLVLKEAFVTYSNESKYKYLGVNPKTINDYNVVSEEVALEMALGVKKISGSDVSVSVTGLAGPSHDGNLAIGTVCFGFIASNIMETSTIHFDDIGRNNIRKKAVKYAISHLIELLENDSTF